MSAKGQIELKLNLQNENARISRVAAVLRSDNGVNIAADAIGAALECPVGNYQVVSLVVVAQDQEQQFEFEFSRTSNDDFPCQVRDNELSEANLLGDLKLHAVAKRIPGKSNDILSVDPVLVSSNGLQLIRSKKGQRLAAVENRLRMTTQAGSGLVRVGSSGFS